MSTLVPDLNACEQAAIRLAQKFVRSNGSSRITRSQLQKVAEISAGYGGGEIAKLAAHQYEKAKRAIEQRAAEGSGPAKQLLWGIVREIASGESAEVKGLLSSSGRLSDAQLHWILGLFVTEIMYATAQDTGSGSDHRRGRRR